MTDTAFRMLRWPLLNGAVVPTARARSPQWAAGLAMCVALVGLGVGAPTLIAQQAPVVMQRATRAELTAQVTNYEKQLASGVKDRKKVEADLAALKIRLADGDFQLGDRFLITITQDALSRSDTATVRDSLTVSLVGLPDVSLKGALRSELNERLSAHVARFLRNSSVRTIVFTRIGIFGGVGRPGYYAASPDQPISELLQLAGGPATDARVNELELKRNDKVLLSAKAARNAFKEGRTLEQLDVRSGDEIFVPQKRKVNAQTLVQILFFGSSVFFAVVNFIRFYYQQQQP